MAEMLIPRATYRGERGTWWPAVNGDRPTASIWCPKCGKSSSLINHTIRQDGVVAPSAVCPSPNVECPQAGCGWHETIKLGGWSSEPSTRGEKPKGTP